MSQKKILVVDDDPDVRLGLQLRLNANHYDVVICAVDGVASIVEARKTHAGPDYPGSRPARG
jgi:DNA-binding response OmpR family regulator